MVKKYLLKQGKTVEIPGKDDKTIFGVNKFEERYFIVIKLNKLDWDLKNSMTSDEYIELLETSSIFKVSDVLNRLGANGKIVIDLDNLFKIVEEYGQKYDEEHNFVINLEYGKDGKIKSAFVSKGIERYKHFGSLYFEESIGKKLCEMINDTIEAMNELEGIDVK